MLSKKRQEEIAQVWNALFRPDDVVEMRSFKNNQYGTISGYFDNPQALIRQVTHWELNMKCVYITLNPVRKELLSRRFNRADRNCTDTTSDADIVQRRWLLVDVDPCRPSDISSSEEEHTAALQKSVNIRSFLQGYGINSILGDSSNGGHNLIPIDLPNDDESRSLCQKVLEGLSSVFSDEASKVDTATFNASRVCKLYGTLSRKGDSTPERPHRYSQILEIPADLQPVPRETLELLAALAAPALPSAPGSRNSSSGREFDLEQWASDHGVPLGTKTAYKDGWKYQINCPFNPEHRAPDAAVYLYTDGKVGFKCSHNSCSNNKWREFRLFYEPDAYDPPADLQKNRGRVPKLSQAKEGDTEEKDTRPEIETNNAELKDMSEISMIALSEMNAKQPLIFMRGGSLVDITKDEYCTASIRDLRVDGVRHYLARCARFVSTSSKRGMVDVIPPVSVCEDILVKPDIAQLPALRSITTAPTFAPDGTLQAKPGYQPKTRTFYCPPKHFSLPDTSPTAENVDAAKHLLLHELLVDFPLVDDASKAHALGMMLLPFVRPMISGATPLHIVDAPTAGSGKTKLATACMFPFLGRAVDTRPAPMKAEEWDKSLFAVLSGGSPVVLIDNCRRLDSSTLELVLTTPDTFTSRILGASEDRTFPVQQVWIATANNLQIGGDLARRLVWIRIDANVEKPEERTGFKHYPLEPWATAHHSQLVGACITLVRSWVEAGLPAYTGKPKGGFENWCKVIGGILQHLGIDGFLSNSDEAIEHMDSRPANWRGLFEDWYDFHGSKSVGVSDIYLLALKWLEDELGDKEGRALSTRIGQLLKSQKGRIYGPYRLESAGELRRAALYRLKKCEPCEPSEPSVAKREGVSSEENTNILPIEGPQKVHTGSQVHTEAQGHHSPAGNKPPFSIAVLSLLVDADHLHSDQIVEAMRPRYEMSQEEMAEELLAMSDRGEIHGFCLPDKLGLYYRRIIA